jgi:hypothetical protein
LRWRPKSPFDAYAPLPHTSPQSNVVRGVTQGPYSIGLPLFLTVLAHFGAVLFHTWVVRDGNFSRTAPCRVRAPQRSHLTVHLIYGVVHRYHQMLTIEDLSPKSHVRHRARLWSLRTLINLAGLDHLDKIVGKPENSSGTRVHSAALYFTAEHHLRSVDGS